MRGEIDLSVEITCHWLSANTIIPYTIHSIGSLQTFSNRFFTGKATHIPQFNGLIFRIGDEISCVHLKEKVRNERQRERCTYSTMYKGNTTHVASEDTNWFWLSFVQCSSIPDRNETIVWSTDNQCIGIVHKSNCIYIISMRFHLGREPSEDNWQGPWLPYWPAMFVVVGGDYRYIHNYRSIHRWFLIHRPNIVKKK